MAFVKRTVTVLLIAAIFSFFGLEIKLLRGTTWNPRLCPGAIPTEPELAAACADPTMDALVAKLDTHTLWLFNLFKSKFQEDDPNHNIPTALDVMKPPVPKKSYPKVDLELGYKTKNGERYSLQVPYDDTEDWPGYEWSISGEISTLLFQWLRIGLFHPLQDSSVEFASPEQGRAALSAAVGHDVDQRLLVHNTDHISDQAISRWAYAGVAAHRLQCPGVTGYRIDELSHEKREHDGAADEYCLLDMSWLKGFPVRPGYERYGATAFFDSNRSVTKITRGGRTMRPGEEGWEHAKWAWKSSVLVGITFRDHLTNVHLMAANQLTIASRERLGERHPLRRLIKPFTYNTIGINLGASKTLAVRNSLVHRATALTWEAFDHGFGLLLNLDREHPEAPKYLELRGTDKLPRGHYPLGEDWLQFDAVVARFVGEYVNLYYKDDAAVLADQELQDFCHHIQFPESEENKHPRRQFGATRRGVKALLSNLFVAVTGVHNQVGNIAEYLVDPSFVSGKIRPGSEMADVQSAFQVLNIALSTASKQPMLLDSVDHLLLDEHAVKLWAEFRRELKQLAESVASANQQRGDYKCNAFNPSKIVFSVSI